jgi:hypothetical protein
MSKLSRDLAIPGGGLATLNPRESIFATAALAAVNAELAIPADGCSTASLVVTGAYVGTLTVEGTIDGANWDSIPVKPINAGGSWLITLASAAVGRWHGPVGPFRAIRVRMSGWTSGAATVFLCAENGINDVIARPKASDLSVTNTGASGAAVTLTLAAPGAGLFHFIDRIVIQRFAAAALTAAATPVLVTTTNLPGSRVFSVPADAALQGTIATEIVEPARPLRSSAANTATTIVAPVTTGAIWRITADYDVAPHG